MINYNVLYKKIDTEINSRKENITRDVCTLVKAKTVNFNKKDFLKGSPDNMLVPGMEYKIIDILKEELDKEKISYELFAEQSKRPHMLIRLGHKDPSYKKTLIIAQADTYPTNNVIWKKLEDPFNPEMIAGKIYGKGIIESKGPITALLHAAKTLKKFEEKIPGEIILAIISDGIVNLGKSFTSLLENETIQADDIIVTYTGRPTKEIVIGEMGHLTLEIIAEGKNHGSNAINTINNVAQRILKYKFDSKHNKIFENKPHITIKKINGNLNDFNNSNLCNMIVDIAYLPDQNAKSILSEIKSIAEQTNMKGITLTFNTIENFMPFLLTKQSSVIKTMEELMTSKTVGITQNTLCKTLTPYNNKIIGIGISEKTKTSTPDEAIKQTELINFTKIISKLGITLANIKN